ncbi:MAG: GNAT family N-acetyltransferase [Ruegeria sp.]
MTEHQVNSLGQPVGLQVKKAFPRPAPPRAPMQGQYCRVVPLDVTAHAPGLFRAFAEDNDGRNWTYLPYGPFGTQTEFSDWLAAACTGSDPLFHTVLDADDRPVGMASFLRIDRTAGSIEVGHIHFSPLMQRTPVSTETMFLMMRRVFDDLGYRRYEWKCDALNAPSRRAAERLGFTFEGVFRQATHYKGRNRDTAWFSIIDSEWPRIRAAFQDWLCADNFDAIGHQNKPLMARSED